MNDQPLILADGAEDVIKYLFGALFLIIWIVGGIVSAIKNKQQEAERRRMQREAWNRPSEGAPIPVNQPPPLKPQPNLQELFQHLTGQVLPGMKAPTPPPLPPSLPMPQPALGGRRKDRRGPRKKAAPVAAGAPVRHPEAAPRTVADSMAQAAQSVPTRAPSSAHASRLIVNARTLRNQFILTEILKPPLALRERSE